MKRNLLKLTLVAPFVVPLTGCLTSCNIVKDFENRPRQIDGSDWIGRQSGYLTEDTYHFDHKNKEIIYWNFSNFKTKNLVIPNYIMYMGERYKVILDDQAFYHCGETLLGSIELNDFAETIPSQCFELDYSLTKVIFNVRPKEIKDNAFYHCSNLVEMKYRDASGDLINSWAIELIDIGNSAFEGAPVSSEGGARDHKEILFGPNLETIGEYAFAGNTLINEIVLTPSTELKKISKKAFFACSALKSVYLSKKLEKIEDAAFSECQNLEFVSFDLLPTEQDIHIKLGKEVFSHCDDLIQFIKNDDWDSQINIYFDEIEESCFAYDPQLVISQFYDHLGTLPDYIFEGCDAVDWKLSINDDGPKPEEIGKYSLAFNPNLAKIDITGCFDQFGKLQEIPSEWNNIDPLSPPNAFAYCASWGKIVVPQDFDQATDPNVQDWIDWFGYQGIEIADKDAGKWYFEKIS